MSIPDDDIARDVPIDEQYRLAEVIRWHLEQPRDPHSFAQRVREEVKNARRPLRRYGRQDGARPDQ